MSRSESPSQSRHGRVEDPKRKAVDDRYVELGPKFSFGSPRVIYGRGVSKDLASEMPPDAVKRPLVLTDKNLREARVGDAAIESLRASGEPQICVRNPGEPTASEMDELAEEARQHDATAVIAVGGGATMDSAKCVRLLLELGGSIRDHDSEPQLTAGGAPPIVAVPTTAGTGSESGAGGLYIDDSTRTKVPVSSPYMRPSLAVSDPDLTFSVPPGTTAATGADALAQAMGPFTSPLRHPITDALSREAVRLISHYLPRAVEDGSDVEARVAVAYGSLLSGMAMNNSEAMADQFFDEVIGPRYRVPHGVVAGVLLPYVMQFNRAVAEQRTSALAEAIVVHPQEAPAERADQVVERIQELRQQINLTGLAELGVEERDLRELATLTSRHYGVALELNPRPLTEEGALAILEAAWHERSPLDLSA